jgi:hypothetical protein
MTWIKCLPFKETAGEVNPMLNDTHLLSQPI